MTTFPALDEARGKLDDRRKKLKAIFDEAGPEMDMAKVKSVDGDTAAKVGAIRTLNEEIDAIAIEVEGYEGVLKAARAAQSTDDPEGKGRETGDGARPAASGRKEARRGLGELFTDSVAYKGRTGSGNGPVAHLDIELKELFETGAGWAPETTRTGRVVEYATRPIQVIDLIPSGATGQSAVVYMEETTYDNAAAETAEGGTYPEAELALSERSSPVRKIAVWLPVTDEQLEDEPQARGYVERRLPFMVRQRLDSQILVGNGTAPNLRGFLNIVGIQTQAKATDPIPDAVYKAMTKVRVTGRATPGAVVMHPNNWQSVRLLRTSDGVYIWGSPSEPGPERIWGLPVAQADGITENTALVGDFAGYSELTTRRGIDVQVSNSHGTFFVEGKQAVRADMRAALVVYRPTAFCTVTGLGA
ncbi:phage major capsid protein [Streptomyces sp. NBRC 109706]|uniref:phage major capsid protein n=1 Tax=Streptomyces sp. NBRC 109706 TaxID=1550035 RepID=UPI000782588E|nr:phage major capsid protein [Streptomyces sp. NBRC 109706]